MYVLGIETSCDETSLAIVENGKNVVCNIISSSSNLFTNRGGVIPEVAARNQVQALPPILNTILEQYTINAIAYTKEPGLQSSLLVGRTAAHIAASVLQVPLVPVHHTHGHLDSIYLDLQDAIQFPVLSLSLSGGHSELWLRTSATDQTLLGRTRDDAIGEAYDKGAMLLTLPYPGGPSIATAAELGSTDAYSFSLPMRSDPTLDFSFSGLKNALRLHVASLTAAELETEKSNLAASYQHALNSHVLNKLERALANNMEIQEIHLVGGVAANKDLRTKITSMCGSLTLRVPSKIEYCTDNGAMIAASAYVRTLNRA